MMRPAVYLVGAGPGDPRLITVHGMECLAKADVVIYDHAMPRRLLRFARADAELIDVGKAGTQETAQDAVSYLLAEKAREGKLVVRLKWGDPFVFDRGAGEALFLHEQRVPFEVVPGIPAGIGVPAYAGVPVTYPGGGDTLTFVRGYDDDGRPPNVDWASLARLDGTVICQTGIHQLPRILEAMLANGWSANDRAVLVYDGTLPSQQTIAGTLGELAETAGQKSSRRGLVLLVAGRVVGFREHLRWFDARPLFGRRVLVTRPREQAPELVDGLTALGADTIEAPMIRVAPPEDPGPLLEGARDPSVFDWIVFTSANAVTAFMHALLSDGRDVRALKGPRLCTVGPSTAERLAAYGIRVDLMPEEFRAEAVVSAMAQTVPLRGARVLLPRADIGRDYIAEQLREAGADVTDVVAYRTVLEDAQREGDPDVYGMLLEGTIDVATFTSASAVRNFAKVYGAEQAADLLKNAVVAVIGPSTADAARQLGIPVTVQPSSYTIPALVQAIAVHFLNQAGTGPATT